MKMKIGLSPDQREMPGADETLPTARFSFDSGNHCDVTVGRKRIDDIESRISVEYAWHNHPSPQEETDAQGAIEAMGLKEPEFLVTESREEDSLRNSEQWLTAGKTPRKPQ